MLQPNALGHRYGGRTSRNSFRSRLPGPARSILTATSGLFRKMLVHEPNCHGALTTPRPCVWLSLGGRPDREDTGSTGLQHQRRTRYITPHVLGTELVGVGTGEHEPVQIEQTQAETLGVLLFRCEVAVATYPNAFLPFTCQIYDRVALGLLAMCSATRQALAMIVSVGLMPVPVGKGPPSTTKRLSTS